MAPFYTNPGFLSGGVVGLVGNVAQSPYGYVFIKSFDTLSPTIPAAIPNSGVGFKITLIDTVNAGGGLRTGIPFIVDWEGLLTMTFDKAIIADIILITSHSVNSKFFVHTRNYQLRFARNQASSIGMSLFNSHTMLQTGRYTDSEGTLVELTAEDLAADIEIKYELEVQALQNDSRVNVNLTQFELENGCQLAYQLRSVP